MPKVLLGCISTAMYGVKAYPEATVNLSGGSFTDISNCSLSLTASTAYISGLVDAAICLGEEASLNVSCPLTEGAKISLVETYLSYGQSVDIAPESEYITEKMPGYFSSPDGYEIYAEKGGLKMKNNFSEPVFDASTGVLTLSGKVDVKNLYMYILLKKWIVKSIVCKKGTVFPKNSAKAFAGLTNLESIDLSKADMSQITDMTAMFAGDVKLKTIIVGTQWSNYLVEESPNVFDKCTNLVGQDGTAYDQDHTDQTYARVDGYDGEKGYFTMASALTIVEDAEGNKTAYLDGDSRGSLLVNENVNVDQVVINRKFKTSTSGFNTLMLPFTVKVEKLKEAGARTVCEFTKVDETDMTVEFSEMSDDDDVKAYTPYLVQMENEELVIAGGVTIEAPEEDANFRIKPEGSDYQFQGVVDYRQWYDGDSDLGKSYGFAAEEKNGNAVGSFVKVGAGATICPFRAYLFKDMNPVGPAIPGGMPWIPDFPGMSSLTASPAPRAMTTDGAGVVAGDGAGSGSAAAVANTPDRMKVVIVSTDDEGEEHTTVIGHIDMRTGEFHAGEFRMEREYDLKGRKVNDKPNARGAYYGRKVLAK